MTEEEMLQMIRNKIEELGGEEKASIEWRVSIIYLSDLSRGIISPGTAIPRILGYKKVVTVTYEKNGDK